MLDENLNMDIRKGDLSRRVSFTTQFILSWHSNQFSLMSQGKGKASEAENVLSFMSKTGEMSYLLNVYIFLY